MDSLNNHRHATKNVQATAIQTMMKCHAKFVYRYVANLRLPPSSAMQMGIDIHERYNNGDIPTKVSEWVEARGLEWVLNKEGKLEHRSKKDPVYALDGLLKAKDSEDYYIFELKTGKPEYQKIEIKPFDFQINFYAYCMGFKGYNIKGVVCCNDYRGKITIDIVKPVLTKAEILAYIKWYFDMQADLSPRPNTSACVTGSRLCEYHPICSKQMSPYEFNIKVLGAKLEVESSQIYQS